MNFEMPEIDFNVVAEAGADALFCFAFALVDALQDARPVEGGVCISITPEFDAAFYRLAKIHDELRRRGFVLLDATEMPLAAILMEAGYDTETTIAVMEVMADAARAYGDIRSARGARILAGAREQAVTKAAETLLEIKGELLGTFSAQDETEAYAIARRFLGVAAQTDGDEVDEAAVAARVEAALA